jgi:2-oxo-3-hexenedioate decarboxylase
VTDPARLARLLDDAACAARPVPQTGADLAAADAYRVQELLVGHRLQRGETLIGVKMGFTSRAKMAQMGVSDLIWGRLTDGMRLEEGGSVAPGRFIHPRVEPEIAFLLKAPLAGAVTPLEAGQAVAAVAPALEIIDSRYEQFKFSLGDVIADNASSSAFVVGAWRAMPADLSNLGMVMSINGRDRQIGSTGAILGDPLRSLAAAARLAKESGLVLQPGLIVLAGAGTGAEPFAPGDHAGIEVEGLGRADIRMRRDLA